MLDEFDDDFEVEDLPHSGAHTTVENPGVPPCRRMG